MPELPEVETVRLSLLPHLIGRKVVALRVADFPGVLGGADPTTVSKLIAGRTIVGLSRRGKYLICAFDDETALVVHLRMTGTLTLARRLDPPLRFERLIIELENGVDLRFADQRKFGRVVHALPDDIESLDRRLGPEPLEPIFTAAELGSRLSRRHGRLKSVLLDQRLVSGLGNIYVDEALFLARVHPLRDPRSLTEDEIRSLHRAIRSVLRDGLANHGTSISSFRDGVGSEGRNQHALRVYGRGRENAPCDRCGHTLQCMVISGRSSHFCPHCQSDVSRA